MSTPKLLALAVALFLASLAGAGRAAAQGSFGSNNPPNTMILLDTSGSMGPPASGCSPQCMLIDALPQYYSTNTYSPSGGGTNYTNASVYEEPSPGVYSVYAANIASVGSASAQTGLTNFGFWFGDIAGNHKRLFSGNYLDYLQGTKVPTSKIDIAKRVIRVMVSLLSGRFGVMRFANNGTQGSGNGSVVAQIGTSTTSLVSSVNAITPGGYTPLGEQVLDAGRYFKGQSVNGTTWPQPIANECQIQSVFVISDGLYNGSVDPRTEATNRYTQDHSTHTGTQNVIVHTVGFGIHVDEKAQALAVLQTMADNGGGSFFAADDPAQLEQALFNMPPNISVTSPVNNSIHSGTINLTAKVPNSTCVSSVKFRVDGSTVAEDTISPYTANWNTNSVANGTHSIVAVALDSAGNTLASYPVIITTNNDQTAPVITNLNISVTATGATISWTTNEPADTQIHYGLTTAYGSTTPLNATMSTNHTVTLSGLTPGTNYHFEALSRDAAGNLAVLGDIPFTTQTIVQAGPLDHFNIRFTAGGGSASGPGTKSGSSAYAHFAGDCFPASIEAVDASNQHNNFTGQILLAQYRLNESGLETELAPGIALRSNFLLGVATMTFNMVNGFFFFGTDTDISNQLCFYQGLRSPGNFGPQGGVGDFHLKVIQVGDPTKSGISAGYIGWHGAANKLALVIPNQTLAPATPTGISSSSVVIEQRQGRPFHTKSYVVDRYWNPVLTNSDQLRWSSSQQAKTGFNPTEASASAGVATSSVTISTCGMNVTLTVEDVTSSIVTAGTAIVPLQACGAPPPPGPTLEPGFYEVTIPGLITAGDQFTMTIKVKNVNIPSGSGSALYRANLRALKPINSTQFTSASGSLGVPTVQFSIPEGTNGDFTFTIPNQTYVKAETIWIQLVGDTDPPELDQATAMAGPMLILAGAPTILTATFNQAAIGPSQNAQMTVRVTDAYGNGIANADVAAQVTEGTGRLLSGTLPVVQDQLITDANGNAVFTFNTGPVSEMNTIRVWAPFLPQIPATNAPLLVSLIGDKVIATYPNPVKITQRPMTIEYRLIYDSDVKMTIVDLFGQKVKEIRYGAGGSGGRSGFNVVTWDGKNDAGQGVAVGVYGLLLEISAGGQTTRANTRFGVVK